MMVIHCWQHGRGAFPFYQAILLIRCEMYRYSIYIVIVEKQSTLTIKNCLATQKRFIPKRQYDEMNA